MNWLPKQRSDLYPHLAFGSVVLACFVELTYNTPLHGEPWRVPVTFLLGGLYGVLGITCGLLTDGRPRWRLRAYYVAQCACVVGAVFASPTRGFFAILLLPISSQAVFDFGWRGATLVNAVTFGTACLVWFEPHGWPGVGRAVISYSAAFVFTIVFSLITREARASREQAQRLSAELADANALLRAAAAQTADLATTRERNRVAREIHDGVGHYLTVVKTQLDAAAARRAARPARAPAALRPGAHLAGAARAAVLQAAHLAGDALDDVRRSVGALRADTARPPLPEALRTLVRDSALPVTLHLAGAVRPLPPSLEHALFRSAQEGLTNLRKHADATAAEIAVYYTAPNRVTLALTDNGRGVNGATAHGFGLIGIRERIEVLGGRVASGNRPGGGYGLTIEVPA